MDAADYAAHGLLDGVGTDGVEARTRLLDGLVASGIDLAALREAARRGRLPLLPLEQALATRGPRRTTREAAEELGLSLELMTAMRRSLGLPEVALDEPALDDADLRAVGRARAAIRAGVPEARVLEMTKLLRSSMSLVADVLYRTIAEGSVGEPDGEDEQALTLVRASETLVPILSPVLDYALTQHLRERVARDFVEGTGAASGVGGAEAEQCVGFADLVGWTARSAAVELPEVAGLADTLTQTTLDHLVGRTRLVKVLGDAVMVTAPTTAEVVDSLRGLLSARDGHELPPVRCGVATGPVAHVQGDVYGPPVDLASRLTDLAAPGTIWLPAYAAAGLDGVRDEGVHRVKGLADALAVSSLTT